MIVAIDGPAGSGKSTTARAVARQLGFLYVDTGAMYRTVALALSRARSDHPNVTVIDLIDDIDIQFSYAEDPPRVFLNGDDVTEDIRTPDISGLASTVAKEAPVRAAMVVKQRDLANQVTSTGGGAVVEGRDIGTVVFPEADLKVFLHARVDERARRRRLDLAQKGRDMPEEEVLRQLADRDSEDSSRAIAPLKAADDALHLDTTTLTFDEQVSRIVTWALEIAAGRSPAKRKELV
ncbi:MAG: (d)CMP kinase [Rhodothermales bacterium]